MANIQAADINNLQNRIALIYGIGSGQSGYGQSLTSSQVDPLTGIIQASDINNIYTDILNARVHQVGVSDLSIAKVTANLNIVAEETSNFINDEGDIISDPEGFKKGFDDFEDLISQVEADKFLVHPTQAVQKFVLSDSRSATWNDVVYQEFSVTFDSADHRRHFFNTGGQIRFSASNSGARTNKGLSWSELCNEVGTVSFGYTTTDRSGVPATYIGNYDLTSAFQTVFSLQGTSGGVYAGNYYTIKARSDSSTKIIFRIEFNDVIQVGNTDNNVDGRLESNIQLYVAKGDYVSVSDPSFYTLTSLSGFESPAEPTQAPQYSIGIDTARDMYEIANTPSGQYASVDYIVQAVNVPYPITLYWDTQIVSGNITAADFTDNTLSGSITITAAYSQQERTVNRTISADAFTEGSESFRLRLYTDSARTNFVDSTGVITIIDNSLGVTPAPTPTYAITVSTTHPTDDTILEENQYTAFYGVQTTEVPEGSVLFYTITGTNITANDFSPASLSGQFTIDANGEGSFQITANADSTTEGSETFDVQLRTGSINGTVVLDVGNGAQTYINDTSLTVPPVRYLDNTGTSASSSDAGPWKWIAPTGVTEVRVRTIGGGGAGYGNGAGGGGGGGFGEKVVTVVPGTTYDAYVGEAGIGTTGQGTGGGNTYFRSLSEVSGRGGSAGSRVLNNTVLSSGGTGGGFIGTNGGNGGNGGQGYWTYGGGGGGGAGGPDGNGGAGGKGGRSVSGIAATEGSFGGQSGGGGGAGSGTISPSLEAGNGGGTTFSDTVSSPGGKGTPTGSTGSDGGSGTGGGTSSQFGGGGGAAGGSSGSTGADNGGSGAIRLDWTLPEAEEPDPIVLNVSTNTLNFESPRGVAPGAQRLRFTASNGNVTINSITPSTGSGTALSIDYTGATGSSSLVQPFTVSPRSPKYIDIAFHGVGASATGSLNISSTENDPVVSINWTEEVSSTPTYSLNVDTGHPVYPNTISNETDLNTIVYTITTTNVPNGTILYWTTLQPSFGDPITESDVNGFTGSFTINNNQGSFTRTVNADNIEENTEYFGTEIRTGSITGPRVAQSFVAIQDTSTPPTAVQYNPQWTLPATIERGVRFTVSATGAAPNTTWTANNGVEESSGTFDANGEWTGDFSINNVGTYSYTLTYSDPTSASDTVSIIVTDPAPETNDTPASLDPSSASFNIDVGNTAELNSSSFTVTNTSTTETVNYTVYNSEKPAGSYTGIYPTTFTLEPGAERSVSVAATSPANNAPSYRYKFAVAAAGYTGTFPEFIMEQFRTVQPPQPSYTLSPSSLTRNINANADYSLTTTNVPNGTTLYLTAFDSQGNGGSFGTTTVQSNAASIRYTTGVTVGAYSINVHTGSATGPIVASAALVVEIPVTGSITAAYDDINRRQVYAWASSGASSVRIRATNPAGGINLDESGLNDVGNGTAALTTPGTYTWDLILDGSVADSTTVEVPELTATGSITFTPATGVINDTVFTVSYTTQDASVIEVPIYNPERLLGDLAQGTERTISAPLGLVGEWRVDLKLDGEIVDSASINVTEPLSGSISWDYPEQNIAPGSTNYTWTTTGATTVQVRIKRGAVVLQTNSVAASGSRTFSYTVDGEYTVELIADGDVISSAILIVLPEGGEAP